MPFRCLHSAPLVGLFTTLVTASAAHASAIGVCNDSTSVAGPDTVAASNGTCAKTVTISGNTLTIVLNNTTDAAFGGFLTADAFNLPGVTATLGSTTNANFTLSTNPSVNPFDDQGLTFNYLLSATGNDWEGGGSPAGGIPAGGSATFVLNLSGNVAGLTEVAVVTGEAIRFRGFVNGGSDKDLIAPGNGTPGGTSGGGQTVVPEPASMILVGSGLAAYASVRRRRRTR